MLIEKIKALFSVEAEQNNVEAKFKDAKLIDGTIVRVEGDEFKVGDALSVITEDGQVVKAPEGMHELEDGTVLVVDAEGIITEIRKPEAEVEQSEEEKKEEEAPSQTEMAEKKDKEKMEVAPEIVALEERIKKLEEAIAMLVSGLESKKEEMEKVKKENESLKLKNEELSKTPAVEPTKTKRFEKIITEKKDFKINVDLLNKVASLREKNK